jgi:hypothetical protein
MTWYLVNTAILLFYFMKTYFYTRDWEAGALESNVDLVTLSDDSVVKVNLS